MTKFKKAIAGTLAFISLTVSTCVPSAFASSTITYNESESNNSISSADIISAANSITTGTISSTSDVDYFKFTSTVSGYYDITLSVPSNCNYNFALYDSTGMITDTVANSSTGKGEICRKYIVSGNYYYIKVYSSSGSSTSSKYKLYVSPSKDINKTWYSQYDYTATYGDYNNNNLPTSFSSAMNQGCALCSIAMVLHNMNAHTVNNITDNRTGFVGKQYADPMTVYMARNNLIVQPNSFSTNNIALQYNSTGTEVLNIGAYFNKTISRQTGATLTTVKNLLNSNPQGVIVRFQKNSDSHYVVFVKANNTDGFVVYDPGTGQSSKGNGVTFNNSYSAINRSFTTSDITEVLTIS